MFRGIRQSLGRLAVTALLTIGAVLPAAAGGKIMLMNGAGEMYAGAADVYGNVYYNLNTRIQWGSGVTQAVFAGNGTLFVYEYSRGWGYFFQIGDDGRLVYRSFDSFGSGWDKITAIGRDRFLLYNSLTGEAKTITISSTGFWTEQRSAVGFRASWTHITATLDDTLFLYNAATGEVVTGRLDTVGNAFVPLHAYQMETGWWRIVAQGNQLLLYRFGSGVGATAILWGDGTYQFQRYLSGLGGEWHQVERTAYGQVFYNARTGYATTTRINPDGSLKILRSGINLGTGWWPIACQREGT
jgi:hypothetical protein